MCRGEILSSLLPVTQDMASSHLVSIRLKLPRFFFFAKAWQNGMHGEFFARGKIFRVAPDHRSASSSLGSSGR